MFGEGRGSRGSGREERWSPACTNPLTRPPAAAALEFTHNCSGRVGPAEFGNVVRRALREELPPHVVGALFHLFGDADGKLNVRYM